ncbi:site-specific DNA-methyltransferase [Cellulosimicrobium cellulans]|nr:site-specific DNA-methyltransferase [Cellulosimicrobium cellulans]
MTLGVRLAGFEIRDGIAWLYGSGFPKSLDVSKAIDKARDDTADIRVVCRFLRGAIDAHETVTVRSIAETFGFHPRMVEHWAARDTDSQPSLPTLEQWDALRSILGFGPELDAEVLRLNLRKGEPGEAWADRPVTGQVVEWENRTSYALTSRDGLRRDVAATDDARAWQGWGTALKPAFEPIVVGRKPLAGTVAANVLAHGTGALNIDATRIVAGQDYRDKCASVVGLGSNRNGDAYGEWAGVREDSANEGGRWPTNVVLDGELAEDLDAQSGSSTSRVGKPRGAAAGAGWGMTATGAEYDDSGGASRFFPVFRYEAKAPTSERPRVDGVAHPTVKPLDLMRWLVRLVTPPRGVVLEPFAGSGTTAEACVVEGFRCIAIEREADYLPLITSRLTKPIEMALDLEVGA